MIQFRLKPYPYLETFFFRKNGDGSAPKTEAGAFDAADINTAGNWTTAVAANDNLIGPRDRVVVLDYDGVILTQLVVQASGLDDSRPITIQGRGFAELDFPVDLNGKVFIVIEDLIYPGNLVHHWTMDEASGNRLDSIGGYTLTEQGVPVLNEAGQIGNASLHVSANNTWLEGASVEILPSNGPLTFSAWLKPGATNGTVQYGLVSANSGLAADWRFAIYFTDARNAANCVFSDGASFHSLSLLKTITTGQYYLVALRRTAGNVWTYSVWDGSTWTDGPSRTFSINPAIVPFAVGATPYGALPANLSVDSIKIWNGWLSNAKVLTLQGG